MLGSGNPLPLRLALVAALGCGAALAPASSAAICAAGALERVGTENVRLSVELSHGTLTARTAPSENAPAVRTFGPRTPEGVTRVFLVRRRVLRADCAAAWYLVDLPIRPNGVRGWVPAAGLRPYVVHWRLRIELGRRRLIAYEGGRERFGRRFPKHFGPAHLARAERMFRRFGVWAVFFGRFVALLRILAGPLAGALRVPYRKFLVANAAGGIVWSFGTTFVIYFVGRVAEKWLKDFSYIALLVAVVGGVVTTLYLRHRANVAHKRAEEEASEEQEASLQA